MTNTRPVLLAALLGLVGGEDVPAQTGPVAPASAPAPYSERYRPQFHFSPRTGWIGDPDGLIRHRGVYHLFWWGHATSTDLVHWRQEPDPMRGDDGSFGYYTGSVVVDAADTSGLGRDGVPPLVAVYTAHDRRSGIESQRLSVSHDGGQTFRYWSGNPVLDPGSRAFRDPDVFWHEPTRRWVMAITLPEERKVRFYTSPDLKAWTHASDFGPVGARSELWEVPNLIRMPLDGDPARRRWVLLCGMGPNREQFFVGDFDGTRFTLDDRHRAVLEEGRGLPGVVFADFEADDYAGWTAEGDAFGAGPDTLAPPLAGALGRRLVSTRRAGARATGTLTSPEFTIEQSCINFLIGGGNHPGATGLELLVDGQVVRQATGRNRDELVTAGWDVSDLRGRRARLRIVDAHQGDWGNVTIDHIRFADVLADDGREPASWIDHGPDFYALRAWRDADAPDRPETIWLGWMGNWDYARQVPTSWGQGAESLPRLATLRSTPVGFAIDQRPIPALETLRRAPFTLAGRALEPGLTDTGFRPSRNAYELEVEFALDAPDSVVGLDLGSGPEHRTSLRYDARTSSLTLDRRRSGAVVFEPRFARVVQAPHERPGDTIRFRVFVDQSSVEVFVDDGRTVLTMLVFPDLADLGVSLFRDRGPARLQSFRAWELNSIWPAPGTDAPRSHP